MDPEGLRKTIESLQDLRRRMNGAVELIIVDGGTGEDLRPVVSNLAGNVTVISESDDGIYDAMNKGLKACQGKFVWFLNGGDSSIISDPQAFSVFLASAEGNIVLANYSLDTGSRKISRRARDSGYIWHGLPTSHQAIFYPGDVARNFRYDLAYKIVGDYDFTARILRAGTPTVLLPMEVASFALGGVSQVHAKRVATEATRVQRNVLGLPWYSLMHSRLRHTVSRNIRALQARS